MPPVRPTLRSLAAEAGVSLTTMSFALRHSREISRVTGERLRLLAEERGYRPDPHVAKLMGHLRMRGPVRPAANICGLCQVWVPNAKMPAGNYFDRLCAGLQQRADSLGYTFSTLNLDDYPRPEQLQRVLVSRGIEGLLLMPMRESCDLTTRLDWRAFSVVSVTSSVVAPQFHRVMPHHFDNMIHACRQLERAGFRRIGMAMPRAWDLRVNHRWTGGLAWQNQFGGTEPVAPLIEATDDRDIAAPVLLRWLKRERPDVVIFETLNSASLEQALRALPARQRPKIVTMNWPSSVAESGIDQQVERIGAVAIEVLAAMLNRGEKGVAAMPNSTMIEGRWVAKGARSKRASTKKPDA
jgi:DNA-binding LacI/PurR family transcriptional regulator